jgi:paraquat-inducible protein B
MQSLITGQLLIQLDFYPGTPVNLQSIDKNYIEIPTIPSTSAKLAEAMEKLDLKALEKHLESTLAGIDRFVNNPDLTASLRGLNEALQDARKLLARVDRQVDPLVSDLKKTANEFGKLANNIDSRVGGVSSGFDKTMTAARVILSPDSPLMVELENTLKEISAMSRSIRQLANYLDQHPEALIRGKGNPGGK